MKERTTAGYVEDVKLILAHGVILYRIECLNKFQISLVITNFIVTYLLH